MWKGSRKLKRCVASEFTLHRSRRSSDMSDCNRQFHQGVYSLVNPSLMSWKPKMEQHLMKYTKNNQFQ